jgi:hypothetical protein
MLTASLAQPMFVARVLLGCLFYLGGFNNILVWECVRGTKILSVDFHMRRSPRCN